jgi:hypothetical protein
VAFRRGLARECRASECERDHRRDGGDGNRAMHYPSSWWTIEPAGITTDRAPKSCAGWSFV